MIRHLEGVFFVSGVGSPLKEGIFAWVKGIGSKFRILCLGIWSLEEKAEKEPMQRRVLVLRTYRRPGAFLDVSEQEK